MRLLAILFYFLPLSAIAAPAWVERAQEKIFVAPVVAQEYRYENDSYKSVGLLTVAATHYQVWPFVSAFGFYGRANRSSTEGHQVVGFGVHYTDAIGVTVLTGKDLAHGFFSNQRESMFFGLGLAFNDLSINLGD